jgi:alkylhydroperoxidase/carboxymuconolactone decarboxylase family protein YurZ
MRIGRSQHGVLLAVAIAAIAIAPHSLSIAFAAGERPSVPQESAATLPSDPETILARARLACPLLGSIIEKFAMQDLGEVFLGGGMKSGSHEIAVVADLAAAGDVAAIKEHARAALDDGATRLELKEVLYLTALSAGVPRAIEATRALLDILGLQDGQCSDRARRAAAAQS